MRVQHKRNWWVVRGGIDPNVDDEEGTPTCKAITTFEALKLEFNREVPDSLMCAADARSARSLCPGGRRLPLI